MGKKDKYVARVLNKALLPIAKAYRLMRKAVKKTKHSMPRVYNQIDEVLKGNLVVVEKGKSASFNEFTDIVVENLIRKLHTLGDENLSKVVNGSKSKSFFDMLNMSLKGTIEGEKDYSKIEKKKLFKRVLIANRGEIALRIIRACKELGVQAIVIYSKPEKNSLFVKFADKAYCIGDPKDYLNIEKIVKVAKKAKADAIHPGYGYLSENADFAELCVKNKIKFIGPSVKALKMMGNKVMARDKIISLGIPIIKGATKPLEDSEEAIEIAEDIGYPVILKASLGGGGKGMRIVRKKEDLKKLFESASNEAKAAFGDGSMYIEKYIEQPRHIEFQILSDKKGNAIHLGERDCSIQRRHQKLIEEAPSTALSDKMRKKIGDAARKVASSIGYEGAGTVEFLLDKKKNYYFMEMNARIQVEHGITEMISGVDLVKEQIRIASGGKLALKQEDIKLSGWAIECRINAEDPFDGFVPCTGTITNYLPPGGQNIRISSHVHAGTEISHHYDPLISNLICGGKNRNEAINRMKRALEEYIIEGVTTNIPFHKMIMENKYFVKGKLDTHFIEEQKIIENLKRKKVKKKELSRAEKEIIVTTAVAKYLEGKNTCPVEQNNWVATSRQESVNNEF